MMDDNGNRNFYYLNRDGRWPDFATVGLERRPDGALQLATVPLLVDEAKGVAGLALPDGPAGLALAADGTLYYSQPHQHRVSMVDGCDDRRLPAPCFGGEGSRPTQLRRPRGLLWHPTRPALVVADSGNNRLQLFDPETFELRAIWGADILEQPLALAADAKGNVYVVDQGARRVVKFDMRGNVQHRFSERIAPALARPAAVAATGSGAATRVYVVDRDPGQLIVADGDGNPLASASLAPLQQPWALAVSGDALYVGDGEQRGLFKFHRDAGGGEVTFVGQAHGYDGPVAAVTVGDDEALWLLPGGDVAPLRFQRGQAHVRRGLLWGGPFSHREQAVQWHRLRATLEAAPDATRFQLFTFTTDAQGPLPPDITVATPFDPADWHALPPNVGDGLVLPQAGPPPTPAAAAQNFLPARYLYVGALFDGEGLTSPALRQLWVNFNHDTYRQHLPDLFSLDPAQRVLLDQLLALFESFFDEAEEAIAALSRLFDPEAAPEAWLPWLAEWVALPLDERWPVAQQRRAIAEALSRHAHRGTVAALQAALRLFAGVEARIEEPLLHAGWWALADAEGSREAEASTSLLGVSTMLVSAEADGAILGSTAALDNAHLITAEERGAPLFRHTAHQFTVQLYKGQAERPGVLDRVRAVLDRETPAHATYHLCLLEPRMRIGFQARLGIDTIVGGPLTPSHLGRAETDRPAPLLGGPTFGRIDDERARIGKGLRLGGSRTDG